MSSIVGYRDPHNCCGAQVRGSCGTRNLGPLGAKGVVREVGGFPGVMAPTLENTGVQAPGDSLISGVLLESQDGLVRQG